MEISTIGLDLAKNVFQIHGINATGWGPGPQDAATGTDAALLREVTAVPCWC